MERDLPEQFDLCVIGCGPGGFAAAMRALDLGRHVCIVEAGEIGGAGVMWGALASKTMWELAKDFDIAGKVDRGYRASGLTVDYEAMRRTVMGAVKEKQYQMLSQIETFSPTRWPGPGSLTLIRGRAAFDGPDRVTVTGADGGRRPVVADHYLVATGSRPRQFPGFPADQTAILDSDGILGLRRFPRRLMIIGAGVIGCEYATIFANFGQTEVFLVDHQDGVIPYEDDDVSRFVSESLTDKGVRIIHSAHLKDVTQRDDHLDVVLDFADGHAEVVEVETVLVSIGRVPNLSGLAVERAGLIPGERGHLISDPTGRVAPNIWAVGDVTPHPALVNIAEKEGRYAVTAMFGEPGYPPNYDTMSTIMFFRPAVAAVGLNERACRRRGIPYRVARFPNALVNRAIAMRALTGFVKIIVSDDDTGTILGMRAAGPQVSSTIVSIAHLMDGGHGVEDVLKLVYPHPTISESIQECLRLLLGKSLYKPQAFPDRIAIRRWPGEET